MLLQKLNELLNEEAFTTQQVFEELLAQNEIVFTLFYIC